MTVTGRVQGSVSGRRSRWTIDPRRMEICFSVELMKVVTVEGRFGKVEGTSVLNDGAPHWFHVDLSIEAASVDTRNPFRDFHLRTRDYLYAKRFPHIAFASSPASGS